MIAKMCAYNTHKEHFSKPNGVWLFAADVTFIYISIKNELGLTRR